MINNIACISVIPLNNKEQSKDRFLLFGGCNVTSQLERQSLELEIDNTPRPGEFSSDHVKISYHPIFQCYPDTFQNNSFLHLSSLPKNLKGKWPEAFSSGRQDLLTTTYKNQFFNNTNFYSENLVCIPGLLTLTIIDIDREELLYQSNEGLDATSLWGMLQKAQETRVGRLIERVRGFLDRHF